MQIKDVKPMTILCYTAETTIDGLGQFVRVIARDLYREAASKDLEVTGPVYWNYYGFTNTPGASFRLEIALPVTEAKPVASTYQIRQTEPFQCASMIHAGAWYDIPHTYGALFHALSQAGYRPTGNNREIYMHMDFAEQDNNLVEIQMGVTR